MGKKLAYTPNSRIKSALRQLWLRSRERAAALKRDGYRCSCGKKQSRAKGKEVYIEVHHQEGILNWSDVYEFLRAGLLCGPEKLIVLCQECHKKAEMREKG